MKEPANDAQSDSMAKIDRLKEEVGWLKIVLGILVAIDASLGGWVTQNYGSSTTALIALAAAAAIVVTIAVVHVNQLAYRRIKELEDT